VSVERSTMQNQPLDSVGLLVRLGRALERAPGDFSVVQQEKELTISHGGFDNPDGLVVEVAALKLLHNIKFVTPAFDGDTVPKPSASFTITPAGQEAYVRLRGELSHTIPVADPLDLDDPDDLD
jgi:hypothetical protein